MKRVEQVDVTKLQKVVQRLIDGVWSDDVSIEDPIPLRDAGTREERIQTTADRARLALVSIHRERGRRIIEHQVKNNINRDLLLMGVTEHEETIIRAAIEMSVRDYLRPLGDLVGIYVGIWDDDDEDEGETILGVAGDPGAEIKVDKD